MRAQGGHRWGLKSPSEAAKEIAVTVAEAEDKLVRATKHFDTQKNHVDDAAREVERVQSELQGLVASMATSSEKSSLIDWY